MRKKVEQFSHIFDISFLVDISSENASSSYRTLRGGFIEVWFYHLSGATVKSSQLVGNRIQNKNHIEKKKFAICWEN